MATPADRILTVPNAVTVARLACLPLFLWLLLGREDLVAAGILLSVLGATDWLDGYLARRLDQVSTIGKILDPVADRLLFFAAVGGVIVAGAAPLWFCVVVLAREIIVATVTVVIAALGARRIDVTWAGKAGTFGLMFAFPLFIGGASGLAVAPVFEVLAWVMGLPGLALSLYAAIAYVPMAGRALREGRAAQHAVGSAS